MTATGFAAGPLSEVEHRVQLRRAVIASTIGTTIEWYDFFLYSVVTGLVFAKLFFPNSDPLVGTLQAFGIYAVGFIARPIGAAIFGHYGDRIGRKSALIATLMIMGVATFLVALVPTYDEIGIWGAVILTVLRFIQGVGVGGEWGGSVLMSMEWARSDHHRGFIASWPQFGVPGGLFLANLAVLAFSQMSGEQFLTWGWRMPFFLSIILVGIGLYIRLGILETPVFTRLVAEKGSKDADVRSDQAAAEGDHPERAGADGRAGAVLHLHGVYLLLWHRDAQRLARFSARRGAVAPRSYRSLDPVLRPHLGPNRPKADVHAGRGDDRRLRLHLLRLLNTAVARADLPRHRAVADPSRHDVWAAGGADRRMVHGGGCDTAAHRSATSWLRSLPAVLHR